MTRTRLEDLDLNLIVTLHWLLTEQSVTRAAQRLDVSQPTVSHALGRLRELLGDPLLIKSGRTMLPTKKAESLQPRVAEIVDRMRDLLLEEESFDPAHQKGKFRIAVIDSIGAMVVRSWQSVIQPDAPGLELDILQPAVAQAQDLIAGKIDAIILPEPKMLSLPPGVNIDDFVQRRLFEERYVTAVRRDHPLANGMDIERYCEADHILINPEGMDVGPIDQRLHDAGRKRRIAFRTETFLLALEALENSDCVLTAPASLFRYHQDKFSVMPCPVHTEGFACYIGWHPNWTHDPQHRWVRERLMNELSRLAEENLRL
ncbi:LysR family transcriptional regulator [Parvularcula sp. ZS-1/3]|uniref:LysR family transcriptional regulator n=1 Tax=Parvularcula mediterranea TaxID=2732508 RepID=A0A7Y3RK40_9PROT|nr:LysR family transcriptional regulator [Parvularcula mediterranea]NNU15496.1 LysR family transcriptional regulator [Parvularcula mediterranea]